MDNKKKGFFSKENLTKNRVTIIISIIVALVLVFSISVFSNKGLIGSSQGEDKQISAEDSDKNKDSKDEDKKSDKKEDSKKDKSDSLQNGDSKSGSSSSNHQNSSNGSSNKTWVPPVYKTVHHEAVYETVRVVVCNFCGAEFSSASEFLAHKNAHGGWNGDHKTCRYVSKQVLVQAAWDEQVLVKEGYYK